MENENQVPTPENQNQVPAPENKSLSTASMVLGIVGLFIFALPCGVLAIIFSILGRNKGGKGFANAGLVLGILDVLFGIVAIAATVFTTMTLL